MRPFLNPLMVGAKRKLRVQDVFAATLYNLDSTGVAGNQQVPLPFVPRLNIQAARNSPITKRIIDVARQGTIFEPSSQAAGFSSPAVFLDGVSKRFPQSFTQGGLPIISWSYAEAEKFYKSLVVNKPSTAAISVDLSSLGIIGEVRAKPLSASSDWLVWTAGLQSRYAGYYFQLNAGAVPLANSPVSVSGTNFILGTNIPAGDYLIQAFAHDPSAEGFIQCGAYNGNGSATGPEINLGWRPQFLELKGMSGTNVSGWLMLDTTRGIVVGTGDPSLYENSVAAETTTNIVDLTATGFKITSSAGAYNESGNGIAYRAIREVTA